MRKEDCLFCKIVAGEIPSAKVYEDDRVLAFEDVNPQMPVHTLIVPKNHYDNIGDGIPDDEMGYLFNTVKKIADLTSECTVMCSNPAKLASGPPMPNAKVIRPMCSIDEYENMRLTSFWRDKKNAATVTDSSPNPIISWPAMAVPRAPSVSTLQRSTAYMATLSSSPDSTAETGVGPSAWASGSQLCSGTRPILVP